MCGLVAAFDMTPNIERAVGRAMRKMQNRGPDGEGIWSADEACLGHKRLAILDLDSRAKQPMHSACGRYVIVFNGEIYNYRDLRSVLEKNGSIFRTTSDTEVVLELFALYGESILQRLQGMYAFVIWDVKERRAFAARDPYGIKPLYIAKSVNGLLLSSQVKALVATGLVSREPCAMGQAGFWLLGSVPEPNTWYRDITTIRPGHYIWIQKGKVQEEHCWRDIGESWRASVYRSVQPANVQDQVRAALKESVRRHLVADVPVGVFLSGGIDSGALAGLMVEAGCEGLEGITITYDEYLGRAQDEAPIAAEIAAYYGIRHHVRKVSRGEFESDMPRILRAMDQPTIDGVNTWYASKAVAECGMKVVVSGVGGDELFQGYASFRQLPRLVSTWQSLSRIPGAMAFAEFAARKRAFSSGNTRWKCAPQLLRTIPGAWLLRRGLWGLDDLPTLMGSELAAEAMMNFARLDQLHRMIGNLPLDSKLALGQIESMTYLRNQLLRDSDWASMDHSVELRTPLVDDQMLRQLEQVLPAFHLFPGKTLLANAPSKTLPSAIVKRKKTGFGLPLDEWMGGKISGQVMLAWSQRVAASYDGESM
jgi:asparagine synthase (glutamine-hydrolysing)